MIDFRNTLVQCIPIFSFIIHFIIQRSHYFLFHEDIETKVPGAPPIPAGGIANDLIAVAVGLVAYLALAFAFHPVVIGVAVMGV